jgi:hypothetical protein
LKDAKNTDPPAIEAKDCGSSQYANSAEEAVSFE